MSDQYSHFDKLMRESHFGTITKERNTELLAMIREKSTQRKEGRFQYLELIPCRHVNRVEYRYLTGWESTIRFMWKHKKFNHKFEGEDRTYFVSSPYGRDETLKLVIAYDDYLYHGDNSKITVWHFDD